MNFKIGDVVIARAREGYRHLFDLNKVGTILEIYSEGTERWASVQFANGGTNAFPLTALELETMSLNKRLLKDALGVTDEQL